MRQLILLFSFLCAALASAAAKPNVILILVDDMGYSDLGCFGSEIETPNIDSLAANGIKFTNFTNCAKCETTRTTLMSGRYHTEIYGEGANSAVTIPENLALGGYQNCMVGKWHIFDTPIKRGFDRYFGFLEGATNFFTGLGSSGTWTYRIDETPYKIPEGFYCTDDFTDWAVKYLDERDKEKPFFMYVAYNAPHYPLQAHKKDVMKYRGKYKDGWEALRKKRHARMIELGIIDKDTPLSKPEPDCREWDALTPKEQDNMDLDKLKGENIFDDTLILFLSDNGACPFDRTKPPTLENDYKPWDGRSYYCYPKEWANAGNTPWRRYKQNQNEGGISTPLIAHWPKGISVPGTFNRQRGHLIDLHATFRDLAGVKYPSEYKGNKIGPARGISLTPAFSGKQRPEHPYLYQNFSNKYTALVMGDWKIVDKKHLYNLKEDRVESNDLAKSNPEKFQAMLTKFNELNAELNKGKRGKKKKKKK
jgi:arylsulfatase